jgi:Arc/MetJ family transcription regulator
MRVSIEVSEENMKELMEAGQFKTKKEAVNFAVVEHIKHLKKIELAKSLGQIQWEGNLQVWRRDRLNK